MKKTILILAFLGLFCGTRMYALGPCPSGNPALSFPAGLHAGDVVTVYNLCEGTFCSYYIPTDGTPLCLDGSSSTYYYGSGGAASTTSMAESNCDGHADLLIAIDTYNGIEDHYYAHWNTGTSSWDVTWDYADYPTDHHYTVGTFVYPDLLWNTHPDGSLYFYYGSPNVNDDEVTQMLP